MVSRQQIEECVDAARLRPIAVSAEDIAAWAEASGGLLADNDNYQLDAEEHIVAAAIPAMERLL